MTPEIKRTTNQYASEYGFFIGIIWIATFICYSEGISNDNMGLLASCLIPALLSIFIPMLLALRINQKLFAIGERFGLGRAYLFSMSMFTFASILSGVVNYAYLAFLNKGALLNKLSAMFNDPSVMGVYKQMGMEEQYRELMTAVNGLTPLDISLSLFSNGIMMGLIASILLAVIASFDLNKINGEMASRNKKQDF